MATIAQRPVSPSLKNLEDANTPVASASVHSTGDIYKYSNLTNLQILYWIGHKLRPESPLFNTILTFTILGDVNIAHFQRAFHSLLEHTDALRSIVKDVDGVPQRKIVAQIPDALEYLDFSQQTEPETSFQAWLQNRMAVSLNLEERLFDSALIKISTDHFIWYLNQHHIIADATSFFLIYNRLAEFYKHLVNEEPLETSEWPMFEDYVNYERAYRDSPKYDKAATYWAKKLNPGPEPINFSGRAAKKKTTRVQKNSYDLGPQRSQKLRAAARQKDIFTVSEDLSLYNIFAALFFAQLHYMSNNRRLGFITPVHNRFAEKFKQIIGLIMELCPLQVEIEANDTFLSLINKVKRETRETLSYYQYGSAISLQNEAFDVMFNTHHMPNLNLNGIPVRVERIHPDHGSESLALHVHDFADSGNLVLNFYFHKDVFDQTQCNQIVQSFVELTDAFLENNAQLINEASLPFTQLIRPSSTNGPTRHDNPEYTPINSTHEVVPPRDQLERQLVNIWEEILDVRPIGIKDNFFDLGGSSWLAVRLFAKIQEISGTNLSLSTLLQAATIEDLAGIICQKTASVRHSLPIVAIQPDGTKQPFFCVHGAGGHVLLFDKLTRYLGPDQPFYAFQAKGVEGEAEPYTQIEQMATYYLKAMREVQPEGPYLLGGYSMGGMVAFEMANQLRAQGQEVALLVIIDTPAQNPHFKYLRNFVHFLGFFFQIGWEKQLSLFLHLRQYIFDLWWFVYRQKFTYILKRLKSLILKVVKSNHTGKPSQATQVENQSDKPSTSEYRLIQKINEINHRAFALYIPKSYRGRIVLIESSKGSKDPNKDYSSIPLQGWDKVIHGQIDSYQVPGDHNEMIREPNVKILAQQLQLCLDKVPLN